MAQAMSLTLRPATLADVPYFEKWDHEPHVIACTSDDPDAYEAFSDAVWTEEITSNDPASHFFIAEVDDQPIGAMLVIDPALEVTHYWGEDAPLHHRAMDIWIGEKDYLNRGFGTQMMTIAINAAFAEEKLEAILIDPLASNKKAHRFYRRLGFKFVEQRFFDEDDCFVFKLSREDWDDQN